VDHVDADYGLGTFDGPALFGGIEAQRRQQVRRSFRLAPCRDRGQRLLVGVARLPLQVGHCLREMDGMFAGARGDLQHEARRRQDLAQDGQDRIAIAGGGRCLAAGVGHAAGLGRKRANRKGLIRESRRRWRRG